MKKGKSCIVSSMALCSDVTMGFHAIETLLLLYNSLFLPVVLYNAQAWTNLTKTDIQLLQRVQLKFLKRTFHAPSSTSNPLTFLETGTLPIQYEIHTKQLGYLHHIVNLDDNDPVLLTYGQQLKYPAPNWANEVLELRERYSITKSDMEIAEMSKESWKRLVKKKVGSKALSDLNEEASKQKKSLHLLPYQEHTRQEYMNKLSPKFTRKIFHIRTGTVDLRGVRSYKYGTDKTCRLCKSGEETVEHVVNECTSMEHQHKFGNISTSNCDELNEIARRCLDFDRRVDDLETEKQ